MSGTPAIILSDHEDSPVTADSTRADTTAIDVAPKSRASSTGDEGIIRRTSSRHVAGTYIHVPGRRRRTRTGSEIQRFQSEKSAKPDEISKQNSIKAQDANGVTIFDQDSKTASVGGMQTPANGADSSSETSAVFLSYAKRDPHLYLHKAVYFLICAGFAAYTPFIALYLSAAGADERVIGMIQAFRPFCILFVTPLWTRLADSGRRKQVLIGTIVMSTIFRALATIGTSVGAVGAFVVLGDIFGAPIFSLLDASILTLLECSSSTAFYGNTRLFGSSGWGAFAPLAGMIADRYGLHATVFAFVAFLVPAVILALKIPVELEKATAASNKGIGKVFKRPQFVLFLIVVFIMGMMASMMGNFLFLFYQHLGATKSLMGLALTFTCISEVPMFFVSTKILKRFGVTVVLFCSMACYFIRLLCYSQLTIAEWTLPIELFHGFTFALGWAAATKFIHEAVPHELASTAQGILSAAFNGLGACVGAFVGGLLFSAYGPHTLYATGACCALVGMIPLGLSIRLARKEKEAQIEAAKPEKQTVEDPGKLNILTSGAAQGRTADAADPSQLTLSTTNRKSEQPGLSSIRESPTEEDERLRLTERFKVFISTEPL